MRNASRALAGALLCALAAAGCSRNVVVGSEPGTGRPGATAGGAGSGASTASLRSELERFAVAQRAYREANGRYASDLGTLGYAPAGGVRVDVIQGDARGFSALASSGDAECAIYSGDVRSPRSYLTAPDVPACRG